MDKDFHGLKSRFPSRCIIGTVIRVSKYWFPVFFWGGVIFYFSGIPHLSSGLGIWDLFLRKVAHLTEYAILTWLLIRAFRHTTALSFPDFVAWSLRLSVFYAFTDEFHQGFVPGRESSVYDVFIDSLGAVFIVLLFTWRYRKV